MVGQAEPPVATWYALLVVAVVTVWVAVGVYDHVVQMRGRPFDHKKMTIKESAILAAGLLVLILAHDLTPSSDAWQLAGLFWLLTTAGAALANWQMSRLREKRD